MKPRRIEVLLTALLVSVALGSWANPGYLRITEVDPAMGQVEVTNTAPVSFTLTSSLPFSHRFSQTSSIPSGTAFAIGESKAFAVTGLDPTDSDLWLYRDSDFGNPASIITGLKYGPAAGVGFTGVAVSASIWPSATDYVPVAPVGQSLQIITYDFTKPENWGTGTPSFGSFFGNGVKIANPLPDIPNGTVVIELETIAEGLVSPLGVAAPDDETGRLFVFDQAGKIVVIQKDGGVLPTPFLDVTIRLVPLQANYDERGLLGLTLHPNFAANGKIYTYTSEPVAGTADFTNPDGARDHQSVVAEWIVDAGNPNVIDVSTRRELFRIDEPQSNHNGGDMHFGPDGMLYIAVGDGGAADDQGAGHSPQGNGQDPSNVYGTILRIDAEGDNSKNGQYGVPADNPFVGQPGTVHEIFAYGFRNPYRFSLDKASGKLYVGDVGQNDVEEIDIVSSGGNYGWRLKEGSFFFNPNGTDRGSATTLPVAPLPPDLIDPIAEYDHADGTAVIGGFVYTGTAIPALSGRYVFGDWGRFATPSGRLFYINEAGDPMVLRIGGIGRPLEMWVKGFGQDQNGELYLFASETLGPSGTTGKVLKIVPAFAVTAHTAAGAQLTIEFTSPRPLAAHTVESCVDLVSGAGWTEVSSFMEDQGSGQFRATVTRSVRRQEFYRIKAAQ